MHFFPSILTQSSVDLGIGSQNTILDMTLGSGPLIKFVMIILILFSVISWAIIFWKFRVFRKARVESEIFLESFYEGKGLPNVFRESRHLKNSPLAVQFQSGYITLSKFRKSGNPSPESALAPDAGGSRNMVEHLTRSLDHAATAELGRLSKALTFLATTGNAAPLLGLFGTVWGIMHSFHSIGITGSANLAVVAPGIAEALVTTVAGLAAAIPAVIFYNYFTTRLVQHETEMVGFSSDFINLVDTK